MDPNINGEQWQRYHASAYQSRLVLSFSRQAGFVSVKKISRDPVTFGEESCGLERHKIATYASRRAQIFCLATARAFLDSRKIQRAFLKARMTASDDFCDSKQNWQRPISVNPFI